MRACSNLRKKRKHCAVSCRQIFGETSATASRKMAVFRRDAKRKPESTCRGRPASRRPHPGLTPARRPLFGIEVKVKRGTPIMFANERERQYRDTCIYHMCNYLLSVPWSAEFVDSDMPTCGSCNKRPRNSRNINAVPSFANMNLSRRK